jgi:hypothetical protein
VYVYIYIYMRVDTQGMVSRPPQIIFLYIYIYIYMTSIFRTKDILPFMLDSNECITPFYLKDVVHDIYFDTRKFFLKMMHVDSIIIISIFCNHEYRCQKLREKILCRKDDVPSDTISRATSKNHYSTQFTFKNRGGIQAF